MDKIGLGNAGSTRIMWAIESSVTLLRSNNKQRWKDPGLTIRTKGKNELGDMCKTGTTIFFISKFSFLVVSDS